MRESVEFTRCPECDTQIGTRGLARHRKTQHGVEAVAKAKPARPARKPLVELNVEPRSIAPDAYTRTAVYYGERRDV